MGIYWTFKLKKCKDKFVLLLGFVVGLFQF